MPRGTSDILPTLLSALLCICACDPGPEAEPGAGSDTDPTGQDPPQCEDGAASDVGFAIEIEGSAVWADDRILDLDGSWTLTPEPGASYDIDTDCETLSQDDASVILQCPTAQGETDEISLALTAGPPLPTIPASVHLQYETHYGTAEFGNPDIVGHAFVLSDPTGLVAAGILARTELAGWGAAQTFAAAVGWEDAPLECAARFDVADACFGMQPLSMRVSIGDDEATVRSGETAAVGDYEVRVGVAQRAVDAPDALPSSGGNACPSFELHHALVVRGS